MSSEPPKVARWKLALGYSTFGVLSFIFFLYLTFPYDVARQRVVEEARNQGWSVTLGSLGPGFFGVTAQDVKLLRREDENTPPAPEGMPEPPKKEPLELTSVSARPSLFPLGVALRSSAFGGSINVAVGGLSDLHVEVAFASLDASKGNLKGFTGLDLDGKLDGELSFQAPKAARGGYDFSQANGGLTLDVQRLVVKGGTATVPIYGTPTPVDLPRITVGDVQGKVKIEKGTATLDQVRGKGEDLELSATGTVKLKQDPSFSDLNVDVKLKAEPEFVKRLGLIGSALSMLPADKENPQFRVAHLGGYLGRPSFGPGMMR